MIRMTDVIKRNDNQWVIKFCAFDNDYNPLTSYERYWRNQGKHWIDDINDATGYPSLASAYKAIKAIQG